MFLFEILNQAEDFLCVLVIFIHLILIVFLMLKEICHKVSQKCFLKYNVTLTNWKSRFNYHATLFYKNCLHFQQQLDFFVSS